MFKNFVRHFSGDLRNMNTNQFLYVTEQHNKHITPKSMSNILFNLLENQKGKKNGFEVDLYIHFLSF